MGLQDTVGSIWNHPLNEGRRANGLLRFARWQVGSRMLPGPVLIPYVNGTTLVVSRGMHGATGNYYVGLMDYEDMSFALHALRPGDLFVDVGANVGSYTIGAASVGANVVAIEPVPRLVDALSRNVEVNHFGDLVQILPIGVWGSSGVRNISTDSDTMNHILPADDVSRPHAAVPVATLDEALEGRVPRVVKIDVVGFESEVVSGGLETLGRSEVAAVILETSGLGADRGYDDDAVSGVLAGLGFEPTAYDPKRRILTTFDGPGPSGNTIFVRHASGIVASLMQGPTYSVLGVDR